MNTSRPLETTSSKIPPGRMSESAPLPAIAFSIEDVCRITSSGRTAVYAAIKSGDLKARKLGRRTVILGEDCRAWLVSLPHMGASSTA